MATNHSKENIIHIILNIKEHIYNLRYVQFIMVGMKGIL